MSDTSPVYTLERHPHGYLVMGHMPVSALKAVAALAKVEGYDLMDAGVATAAKATLAITNEAGAKAWRDEIDARAVGSAQGDAELAWLRSTDTGVSSKTIFSVLSKKHGTYALGDYGGDVPHDPSDFGRCYRLLKAVPSWRSQLDRVAKRHKAWRPLVREWDRLEALYEAELPTGKAPKLFALMRELRDEASSK